MHTYGVLRKRARHLQKSQLNISIHTRIALTKGDQGDDFIESHEEDHEDFEQGEFVQNEIPEHGADIENANLEAHEDLDYQIYETNHKRRRSRQ